jgi:hypothetical protein
MIPVLSASGTTVASGAARALGSGVADTAMPLQLTVLPVGGVRVRLKQLPALELVPSTPIHTFWPQPRYAVSVVRTTSGLPVHV